MTQRLDRIFIDDLQPATPSRRYPAKAIVGERVTVGASLLADGHNQLAARLRWRPSGSSVWMTAPMRQVGETRWEGELAPETLGSHEIVVDAWRDRFSTWRHDIEVRYQAGEDLDAELEEGARILEDLAPGVPGGEGARVEEAADALRRQTCEVQVRLNAGLDDHVARLVTGVPDADLTTSTPLPLWVDRLEGAYGAWYELFPRSEGGLAEATKRLPGIADMGFNIVYLPPIHPIGVTARKGRNNTLVAEPGDPGSPWAIGSAEGDHTAIEPSLGTLADFHGFVEEAEELGLEVALDYALQCSPDHPWVSAHPEWFWRRADGSIRYAENPPKKYQDIYPINFWPEQGADRAALWSACRDVMQYWIDQGIRIFRVDNPHTKPLAFWSWLIESIHRDHPDVVLLSEAFTHPDMMAKLAEVGFTQSYTYFTWKTFGWELREYVEQLAYGPMASYMRPNFWPNTPDILSGPLRHGPPAAFRMRFVLAATLVPSYGIYSGYELYENEPASDDNEEYLYSEKYELRRRDWDRDDAADARSMTPFITQINQIRRRHTAFQWLKNIRFHHSGNDAILAYSKRDGQGSSAPGPGEPPDDLVMVVVNLDPDSAQATVLGLDLDAMGLQHGRDYLVRDELGGETYTWNGPNPYVRLDPALGQVAHILTFAPA